MNSTQPPSGQGSSTEKSELARQFDFAARAIFVIWIGIAMLLEISWGWFLVGFGILIPGRCSGSALVGLPRAEKSAKMRSWERRRADELQGCSANRV